MPIPPFSLSGVLPAFTGATPASPAARAPYHTNTLELCTRFGSSAHRVTLLQGYLNHRAALAALGFVDGFQWCDGSFVEDKNPNDIDVVTFVRPPALALPLAAIVQQNQNLFYPPLTKQHYRCDVYFIDLSLRPELLTAETHYWYGLFSHRRNTAEWKGFVQLPLHSPIDDAAATAVLAAYPQPQAVP